MKDKINVLSLFDGISCGQVALERVDIKVNNYFSSEIDKYAIQITQKNYPNTIQLGNINDWKTWDIDWNSIDLLIGGSPCQGFSFAGKQLNFNDPRSKLFFIYVDILNYIKTINPNIKFLLENVKMKQEYLNIISENLGVKPVLINSSLVSAQNRQRYYWANFNIDIPINKNIFLKDIIEKGIVDRDKSYCLDANYWKGTTIEQYINKARRQIVLDFPVAFTERRTEHAKKIRKEYKEKYGRDFCSRRDKELQPRADGKMNCLTATYNFKEHTLIDEKINYRKLTPIECERLQTLPDNYTQGISNSQRYKMLGNGWTVDVIAHIFKGLKND